ncbi:MAG: T9SS type A sorting domain-containing protein [Bacteroidales bacterium]|nr:T9SS type A sorting domain-containing protein [Bacteroidales bacterium]
MKIVSDVFSEGDGRYSVVNILKGTSAESNEIVIYPNLANGLINIFSQNEIINISVYNNIGQIVYKGTETKINVNNFVSGVYFIRINDGKELMNKKILIE